MSRLLLTVSIHFPKNVNSSAGSARVNSIAEPVRVNSSAKPVRCNSIAEPARGHRHIKKAPLGAAPL